MIRAIFLAALLLGSASASAATYTWRLEVNGGVWSSGYLSAESAVKSLDNDTKKHFIKSFSADGKTAYIGCTYTSGSACTSNFAAYRSGDSCPAGTTYNTATGGCDAPVNPCTAKAGTITTWTKKYASFDAYSGAPMGEHGAQDGCAFTVNTMECGSNAQGEFACWGSGSYTGDQSTEGEVEGCLSVESCTPPEPTTAETDQTCSPPTSNGSTTTYTCVTSSSAEQFAGSNCAYGEVNGTAGYHCTSPDYVPASDTQTRTDEVSETTNPDGSKTTTTTSSTEKTYCEGGDCKTTSTTTTTTKGTDPAGNSTGETTTCTGDECKGPEDPKDGKMPGTVPGPSTAEAFPQIGEGSDTPDYAESVQAFYGRISGAPIVSALGGIEVPTGGNCNIGSASLWGGQVSFNDFCDLAPELLEGLRMIFLAIWAWAAIRLFFTA